MSAEQVYTLSAVLAGLVLGAGILGTMELLRRVGAQVLRVDGRHNVLITPEGPELHQPLRIVCPRPERAGYDPASHAGVEHAVVFLTLPCPPCDRLLKAVSPVRRQLREPPPVFLVLAGQASDTRIFSAAPPSGVTVYADPSGELSRELGIERTPFGLLIDGSGILRMKGVLSEQSHLAALFAGRGRAIGNAHWELVGPVDPKSTTGSS